MIHVYIIRSGELDANVGIVEPPFLYIRAFDVLTKINIH